MALIDQRVELHSLNSQAELNGISGLVEDVVEDTLRLRVRLCQGEVKGVKLENVRVIDEV